MRHIYIPYVGSEPALVSVKGHNFIILARNPEILAAELHEIGADSLREMAYHSDVDENENLDELAREINGAIVIAPEDVAVADLLDNLAEELPWLH
jgi:hypothetical protein